MRKPDGEVKRVARVADVADGDIIAIAVDGVPMVLYRAGARLVAVQRRCPHQGSDFTDGLVVDDGLLCGSHGWRFDAVTGQHDSSTLCLRTYPVRVVGEDVEVSSTPSSGPPDVRGSGS